MADLILASFRCRCPSWGLLHNDKAVPIITIPGTQRDRGRA